MRGSELDPTSKINYHKKFIDIYSEVSGSRENGGGGDFFPRFFKSLCQISTKKTFRRFGGTPRGLNTMELRVRVQSFF